jgi:putative addiction module component (TIGR02574 family)
MFMSSQLDERESQVLNLAVSDRVHLLDRVISSLEADSEISAAWASEAERRDDEIESGKVELLPGNEVIARARAMLL